MPFRHTNTRAVQSVDTSLDGITRVSYADFQPNRSRNMDNMNIKFT